MAQSKKSRSRKKQNLTLAGANWPVWYFPDAPLGSAVRYIASLSPHFDWVGISVLKGKVFEKGPSMGSSKREPQSEWTIPVRNRNGKVLGQIEIESHSEGSLGIDLEEIIRRVASELGELWPE